MKLYRGELNRVSDPRSYIQTLVIARIARAGGKVGQAALFDIIGHYRTNILSALVERELIQSAGPLAWELTEDGHRIALELFGAEVAAKFRGGEQ